jgi:hypothetical protein
VEYSADANVPLRVTEHNFKFCAWGRCYACTNVHGLFEGNLYNAMVFDRAMQHADVAMLHDATTATRCKRARVRSIRLDFYIVYFADPRTCVVCIPPHFRR